MTEGNYSRYVGGDTQIGETKTSIATEIAKEINMKIPGASRNARQVMQRINVLLLMYKAGTDWINETGAGVDDEGQVQEFVKKHKCAFYYDLQPILDDRHTSSPLYAEGTSFSLRKS